MRDFFTFNGINSSDFGCFVADANKFGSPARDYQSIAVPGMNGELTIDKGRYKNKPLEYSMYVSGDIRTDIMGLRNALSRVHGYQRVEDTYDMNEFYLARFVDEFEVKKSDRCGASFKVVFDRKPQRFLKEGERVLEYTASGSLVNATDQIAKPLIRVYGTGRFAINNTFLTISSANVYTDIDCEIEDAYKGTTNCNGNISGSFPVINPGMNAITLDGVSKLEITPRWWVL